MSFDLIFLTLALVTARWWLPSVKGFLTDIRDAGDPDQRTAPAAPASPHTTADLDDLDAARAAVHPVFVRPRPALPRKERRDFARKGRWEAGFGRRGL